MEVSGEWCHQLPTLSPAQEHKQNRLCPWRRQARFSWLAVWARQSHDHDWQLSHGRPPLVQTCYYRHVQESELQGSHSTHDAAVPLRALHACTHTTVLWLKCVKVYVKEVMNCCLVIPEILLPSKKTLRTKNIVGRDAPWLDLSSGLLCSDGPAKVTYIITFVLFLVVSQTTSRETPRWTRCWPCCRRREPK